jgi:hypothetical protein
VAPCPCEELYDLALGVVVAEVERLAGCVDTLWRCAPLWDSTARSGKTARAPCGRRGMGYQSIETVGLGGFVGVDAVAAKYPLETGYHCAGERCQVFGREAGFHALPSLSRTVQHPSSGPVQSGRPTA